MRWRTRTGVPCHAAGGTRQTDGIGHPSIPSGDIEIREHDPAEDGAVLDLLAASLGWVPDTEHRAFFEWKHRQNPFGASPAWVAVDDGRVVGFRTFLRWELRYGGDDLRRAVRAVDTATHPDWQGRGIFSSLTRHALAAVTAEGVDFVFNTPNDQSRPGYLKLGWQDVGRLGAVARPTSLRALPRIAASRVPADKWSLPSQAGVPAADALADGDGVERLLASILAPPGLSTARSVPYLRWRYGFAPLHYRAVLVGTSVEDGIGMFRVRRRGKALEAAVVELLVPDGDRRRAGALLRSIAQRSGADHLTGLSGPGLRAGAVPLVGQGPRLVWRAAATALPMPALSTWKLTLGDIELF